MTIKTEGGSAKARVVDFELSDHYNEFHQPVNDFGKRFFDDWDDSEWNDFYNLLAWCVCVFLRMV